MEIRKKILTARVCRLSLWVIGTNTYRSAAEVRPITSYQCSIVTRASRTVSEINGDFYRKSPIFHVYSVYLTHLPLSGFPLELRKLDGLENLE